ncbi:pseudouridine synthase, partial [Candidatus Peregrinibacteria bacterium]|nr:pseudouridine synthase [Candidatus Peregrinibacteria bacterium]
MIRLNKFIAMSGITSRRKADELILAGKVSINGIVHTELGTRIDPNEDIISINGKELEGPKELV